ncbi:hypothetical protein AGDE_15396 [Angomonas deanei]|uniref:Uncharacterized protein n=1 Tax=Angomonas deanei TaxID=59799 RepID=A0A7G2CIQ1_9TRYP|nr:hypothetical protein AGDE_15396 [Angomonas deanei]CAD2218132.1 hypothetical protein, conserved [Angomonas deanei]|eukprot:EPY19151.1 hypothetical protein AGDE_15396 [Angomonas deanei]
MSGKEYYENPFDNDDDDTCFATIELDVDDDTSPNHTGFSSRKRSSQYAQMTPNQSAGILQVRSRGASMKQSGHSDHSRRSLHYADDGEVEERSVGRVVVPATNLRSQLTNERSSATRRSVTRGNMDPTSQEAIHQVESSYEEIVQSLRSTLTEMQGENSLLRNEKHKLESQLRAVRLEKENCEFNLQKEKNRSAILEEQVQALEEELASMQTIRHQRSTNSGRVRPAHRKGPPRLV